MSSNGERRGGGKRRNYNNNKRLGDGDSVSGSELANNNVQVTAVTSPSSGPVDTTLMNSSSSSSSSSNNYSSGEGTAVFNTADEGEDGDTVQEISSEEEEEDGVVNASLIVNLSNANSSVVVERGGSPRILLGEGSFVQQDGDAGGQVLPSTPVISRVVDSSPQQPNDPVVDDDLDLADHVEGDVSNEQPPDNTPLPPSADNSVIEDNVSGDDDDDDESSSTLADLEVEKLIMTAQRVGASRAREVVEGLPSTVTVLKAPNGVVVYVIGTAHFSQQSQVDVAETIQMTRPTIVLLELCSSRKNILDLDEETVLREVSEMNFQKVRLALSNSGTVQGTLHLLLLSMSAQLTKKLGMAPGGEFRVATREGRKIPGSVILLGDRPFNITISRALAALSFFQKIKLAWQFLTCNEDITREEIEKCKEKDLLERMLTEMTGEFPTITEVFVNERDVYLAHSLYLAATSEAHKSNGGPVVGVVGMGHVAGIVRNWGKTTDGMVNEIVRIPPTPISTLIIRKSVKLLTYGLLGYAVYRVGRRVALPESFKRLIGDGGSRLITRFKDVGVKGIGL